MIAVADFMTRDLVTVGEADDLALAESLLRLGGIRHLPVVQDGRVVGLLTHRDVVRTPGSVASRKVPVRDVMTRAPVCVRARSSLAHAARVMLDGKFGCLPVTDDDDRLVGIVTEVDFVRFAAEVVRDLDRVAEAVRAGEGRGDA
jgi:CBS domain-containing protein